MGGATGSVSTYRGDDGVPADALLAPILPAIAARSDPDAALLPIAADRTGVSAQVRQLGGASAVARLLAKLGDHRTTTATTTARQACRDFTDVVLGDALDDRTNSAYRQMLLNAAERAPARSLTTAVSNGWTVVGTVLENDNEAGIVAVLSGVHWSTTIAVFSTGGSRPLDVALRATKILLQS
jgi:hypothetical protein